MRVGSFFFGPASKTWTRAASPSPVMGTMYSEPSRRKVTCFSLLANRGRDSFPAVRVMIRRVLATVSTRMTSPPRENTARRLARSQSAFGAGAPLRSSSLSFLASPVAAAATQVEVSLSPGLRHSNQNSFESPAQRTESGA